MRTVFIALCQGLGCIGDAVSLAITIPRVGKSSLDFCYQVRGEGTPAIVAEATITKVCVTMESLEPRPMPPELVEVFRRYGDEG